jgi:Domain of unknown function (DUF4062)
MAKIYLSSTYSDLKEHRRAVYGALRRLGHDVIAMEDYVAADMRPLAKCLADVKSCHVYVGIFAWKYGFVPSPEENPEQNSITELEYREAERLGKTCLIFLLDEDALWPPKETDAHTGEGDGGARIRRLREELQTLLVDFFTSPEQLAGAVATAVMRRGPDRPPELARVLSRLRGLRGLEGKQYDDEKLILGPELDDLGDAIAAAGDDPEWRAAYDAVRDDILLQKAPGRLDEDIARLEALGS